MLTRITKDGRVVPRFPGNLDRLRRFEAEEAERKAFDREVKKVLVELMWNV